MKQLPRVMLRVGASSLEIWKPDFPKGDATMSSSHPPKINTSEFLFSTLGKSSYYIIPVYIDFWDNSSFFELCFIPDFHDLQ